MATFQQHQQHIYANAANLQSNQFKLSVDRLGSKDDQHVYSNVPLSLHKLTAGSGISQSKTPGAQNGRLANQTGSKLAGSEMGLAKYGSHSNGPASDVTSTHLQRPLPSLPLPPRPSRVNNCIVPANPYLTEEIPDWLYVYSKAPPEHDHKLKVLSRASETPSNPFSP